MGCGKSKVWHTAEGDEQQTTPEASSRQVPVSSQRLGLARESVSTHSIGPNRGADSQGTGSVRGSGSQQHTDQARILATQPTRSLRPSQASEAYSQGAASAGISAIQNKGVAGGPGHPQGAGPSSYQLNRVSGSSLGGASVHRSSPSSTPRTPRTPQDAKASSSPMRAELARRPQASSTVSLGSKVGRPPRSSSSPSLETEAARPHRAASSHSPHSPAPGQPRVSSTASLQSLEEGPWHMKASPSVEALLDALEKPSTSSPPRRVQQSSPRGTAPARQRPSPSGSSPKAGSLLQASPQGSGPRRPRFEPTPSEGELSRYFSATPITTLPDDAHIFDEFGGSDTSN